MRKQLGVLLCIVLVFLCLAMPASAEANYGFTVFADNDAPHVGETVTFTVLLHETTQTEGGIHMLQLDLAIPEGMTYVKESGTFIAEAVGIGVVEDTHLNVKMDSSYAGNAVTLMTFQCTVDAEGTYDVSLKDIEITDKNEAAQKGTVTAAQINTAPCQLYDVQGMAATCQETGVLPHQKCNCGRLFLNGEAVAEENLVIAQLTHQYGALESGADSHWKACIYCGEKTFEAEHNWLWVVDKAATVDAFGLKHEVCSICATKRNTNTQIPQIGWDHKHAFESLVTTQDHHWYECECGARDKENAHEWKWVVDKAPNTFLEGVQHEQCDGCGSVRNEGTEISKLEDHEHQFGDWLFDAQAHWKQCQCGVVSQNENHSFAEWTVVQDATEKENGLKKSVCVCAAEKTAEIPATGISQPPVEISKETVLPLWTVVLISVAAGVAGASCVWFILFRVKERSRKSKYYRAPSNNVKKQ